MDNREGEPLPDVLGGCRQIIRTVLGARKGERVAIVVDRPMASIGWGFFDAASESGCEAILAVTPTPTGTSKEPPERIARLLRDSDVFVIPTTVGMTHTRARREASAAGARGVTLPGITTGMLRQGGIFADYALVARATEKLAKRLTGVDRVELLSEGGTELTFDVHGGVWFAERGLCTEAGEFGNAPGGEVSIAPVNVNGTLVVDGSINRLGLLRSPLRMLIRDRYVVSIEGEGSDVLMQFLQSYGPNAFNVAEIGIGMNPSARLIGRVLEDEKVLGTVHVGIGDNSNMGGKSLAEKVSVGVHIDGVVVSKPQLLADGQRVDPREFF